MVDGAVLLLRQESAFASTTPLALARVEKLYQKLATDYASHAKPRKQVRPVKREPN